MTKLNIIILTLSITFTSLISTLFGFAGSSIIGTFWSWFWISWLVQFIGFVAYNSYLIQKDDIALQRTEIQTLEQLSKFVIKINCAYCQQTNATPIQLNKKNTFKCESCNQVSGIVTQFTATTITTPIQTNKFVLSDDGLEITSITK
jgi:hypothetical protein